MSWGWECSSCVGEGGQPDSWWAFAQRPQLPLLSHSALPDLSAHLPTYSKGPLRGVLASARCLPQGQTTFVPPLQRIEPVCVSGPSAPACAAVPPCSAGLFARQRAGTCRGRGDYPPGAAAALPQRAGACAGGGEDPAPGSAGIRDRLPEPGLTAAALTSADEAAPVTQDCSYRSAEHPAAPRQAGSVGELEGAVLRGTFGSLGISQGAQAGSISPCSRVVITTLELYLCEHT